MTCLQKIRAQVWVSCGLFISVLPIGQAAQTVTLQWNPSSSSNISGYRLYYGTSSGVYTHHLDIGKATVTSVSNLMEGKTYFFSVSAYNTKKESRRSNEISYTVPFSAGVGSGSSMANRPSATPTPARAITPPSQRSNVHDMKTYPLRPGGSVEAAAYAEWCGNF
jgi:Fibronectin type III domain